jgi:hypothetical protein
VTSFTPGAAGLGVGAAAWRMRVAICGLLIAVLSGCAKLEPIVTVTPDYGYLEQDIRTQYSEKLGAAVDRVQCPRLGEIQVPRSFNCDAYVGSRHFSVSVKYDSVSNPAMYSVSAGTFVNVAKLQGDIESDIRQKAAVIVQADCGPEKYKLLDVGDTFQCTVVNNSNNHRSTINAKVTDKGGGVDFEWHQSAL